MDKSALVLLSGGLDSATLLWWAQQRFYCQAVTFLYGQKHAKEINSARTLARVAGCPLCTVRLSLPVLRSSLTDRHISIPSARPRIGAISIPSTYVPGRNSLFLSAALSIAESAGIGTVLFGANAVDFSGYPDCRPDYIRAMQRVSRLGTKIGREGKPIKILAPFLHKSKADIIRLGMKLGVPYEKTWSCYRGGKNPCHTCESCVLRERGFREAHVVQKFKSSKVQS
jgi:7-cyano-7-deazaguanine synthase